jgi:hypothetical protein
MADSLPSSDSIESLLKKIDALIGLGTKFPASRWQIKADLLDRERYETLWAEVDAELANVRTAGFPIANPNLHADLESMWAWCVGFGGKFGSMRTRPHELYLGTIERLKELKTVLSDADAPLEAQRELRESALRTNELFIIMAFRTDTDPFRSIAESAASAVGLTPVVMDEQEPEQAISEAILSSIRRSTLVLCDLSFERANCYFEAGFAKGAMRRILFSCRSDHDLRRNPASEYRVHFDVDQFKITWWDAADLDTAQNELEGRLRALLTEPRLR